MNTTKILTLESGQEITVRRPAEAELLAYLDKRALVESGQRISADAFDDGDYELLALVTSPDRAAMDELLEDLPLLNRQLRDAVFELSGGGRAFIADPSVITDAHRGAGRRLLGFRLGDTPIVLTKLTRYEVKELEHRVTAAGRKTPLPGELAKLAREHLVALAGQEQAARDLLADVPMLGANLGVALFRAAQGAVKVTEGK